jgi:DNA-binding Lrp family transcriptional regulator
MERAIVLINLSPGAEESTLAALRTIPGVDSAYQLYGLYDMLVIVQGENDQAVKSVISDKLRSDPNIASTITMKILG